MSALRGRSRSAELAASAAFATLAAAAPQAVAQEHALVETLVPRATCFVGEAVGVRLRIGVDERFFQEHALQLFPQQLDVPVQVDARWLDELPGATVLPAPDPREAREAPEPAALRTLAVNSAIAHAKAAGELAIGARRFALLEIERTLVPDAPGDVVLEAPALRYAYATRFSTGFLGNRIPLDRSEGTVAGERVVLRVEPLPQAGQPPSFCGAVGRFTIRAATTAAEAAAGEILALTLTIEGEGNFGSFEPPSLAGLEGFHVYGVIEEGDHGRRTLTYDLAPLHAGVTRVAPIELSYFDPEPPGAYRTLRTDALPIRVRGAGGSEGAGAPPVGEAAAAAAAESDAAETDAARARRRAAWAAAAVLVALAAGAGLELRRRARARARHAPELARARRAAAASRASVGGPEPAAAAANAFAEFLAAWLRCRPAAVIAPDLAERLAGAGIPDELAARAAAKLEELVAARYAGGRVAADARDVRVLVDQLEAAFEANGRAAARGPERGRRSAFIHTPGRRSSRSGT